MKTRLYMLTMVRSFKLEWKLVTKLGALDSQKILTGIKALHKMQVILGKDVMTMQIIFKNGKQLSIATLHEFIISYNGNKMETITLVNVRLM